jgi:hypothetical protein
MVGARSIARLRARSCTAALPAARALAVNRAPRSPPSFTPLRLARRAALTPLDPLATQHTLLFDRGDDHAVPPQPSLLSSKPQTATAASIANTAAKRPSSAAHAKPRQRNASRPIIINSRSLVIRCKTARTGNVRARMWSAGSGLAAQLRLALDQWHCWIGPPPALSHLHRRLHRRSCRPPSRSLSHRRASERTALPALPTVQAL